MHETFLKCKCDASAMLDEAVKNSGLEGIFADHLSTDRVRAFKPDPQAYRMAMSAFGLRSEERRVGKECW